MQVQGAIETDQDKTLKLAIQMFHEWWAELGALAWTLPRPKLLDGTMGMWWNASLPGSEEMTLPASLPRRSYVFRQLPRKTCAQGANSSR
jgi:hypothetical protein